ncbi:hypothetical protein GQ43DRAFT_436767 [Delitschia confertaspora ATCC 74209]|uniref:Uncharacterized protein n=1 Tax=Delitschia confertaspora ATCC 74209 TaxID=1513339 RepID=A0A9P4MTV8_9PLEO|nr:hypothetical protein GQ43DRAFT_436767 [Delitschia confertaspora ATCC 74209]
MPPRRAAPGRDYPPHSFYQRNASYFPARNMMLASRRFPSSMQPAYRPSSICEDGYTSGHENQRRNASRIHHERLQEQQAKKQRRYGYGGGFAPRSRVFGNRLSPLCPSAHRPQTSSYLPHMYPARSPYPYAGCPPFSGSRRLLGRPVSMASRRRVQMPTSRQYPPFSFQGPRRPTYNPCAPYRSLSTMRPPLLYSQPSPGQPYCDFEDEDDLDDWDTFDDCFSEGDEDEYDDYTSPSDTEDDDDYATEFDDDMYCPPPGPPYGYPGYQSYQGYPCYPGYHQQPEPYRQF